MGDFGHQLRELRVRRGLTQADLAEASSLGQSTISALETGRQGPWPSTRRALARALHLSLEELDMQLTGRGEGFQAAVPEAVAGPRVPRRGGRYAAVRAMPGGLHRPPPGPDYGFASSKVMELLDQLGKTEHELRQHQVLIRHIAAAGWTTDHGLRVTGVFGPLAPSRPAAAEALIGRPLPELIAALWSETGEADALLVLHEQALGGAAAARRWAAAERRYLVFADPVMEGGDVAGTAGLAIDVTEREPGA